MKRTMYFSGRTAVIDFSPGDGTQYACMMTVLDGPEIQKLLNGQNTETVLVAFRERSRWVMMTLPVHGVSPDYVAEKLKLHEYDAVVATWIINTWKTLAVTLIQKSVEAGFNLPSRIDLVFGPSERRSFNEVIRRYLGYEGDKIPMEDPA